MIQPSTIEFCAAGSGSVGPSQRRSTPSCFAASSAPFLHAMKYAFPLLLGIIAIVIDLPAAGFAVPAFDASPLLSQPAAKSASVSAILKSLISLPFRIRLGTPAPRREPEQHLVQHDRDNQENADQDPRELARPSREAAPPLE